MGENATTRLGGGPALSFRGDSREFSGERRELQHSAYVDELLVRLRDRLNLGRLDEWEGRFARSILGQARRGGWRWKPSPRQLDNIERIVSRGWCDRADDEPLIEEWPTEGGAA